MKAFIKLCLASLMRKTIFTFAKFLVNEVIFNNKKSIVITVRDLTGEGGLFESKAKI